MDGWMDGWMDVSRKRNPKNEADILIQVVSSGFAILTSTLFPMSILVTLQTLQTHTSNIFE